MKLPRLSPKLYRVTIFQKFVKEGPLGNICSTLHNLYPSAAYHMTRPFDRDAVEILPESGDALLDHLKFMVGWSTKWRNMWLILSIFVESLLETNLSYPIVNLSKSYFSTTHPHFLLHSVSPSFVSLRPMQINLINFYIYSSHTLILRWAFSARPFGSIGVLFMG